ncbi:MAG: elongation factor G [Spirochaetaceae bacterium]|nr:elongation factor G [Spirochaetaceae bacterium]
MSYSTDSIKNTVIIGHGNTGKTSLLENILFTGGKIAKAETIESGKTVSDYAEEEIEKKISIYSTLSNIEWNNKKLNFIDTPGSGDFTGEVISGFRACQSALVVVGCDAGVQIETIKLWRNLDKRNMSRVIFINRCDKEKADFKAALHDLKTKFQKTFVPIAIPIGVGPAYKGIVNLLEGKAYIKPESGKKEENSAIPSEMAKEIEEYKTLMIEAAAEGDDSVTEKYLENGTLTDAEIILGLTAGLSSNKIIPVLCGTATQNSGIVSLLNFISSVSPTPDARKEFIKKGNEEEREVTVDPSASPSLFVFKTSIDQFSGKLSYIKVVTGVIKTDTELYNTREAKKEKVGKIFTALGKKLEEVKELAAGDIGIAIKLPSAITNDTLRTHDNPEPYRHMRIPNPIYSISVSVENKKDEDKVNQYFHKIAEEDLTFQINYNPETKESIISGMGELHINMILDKLKEKQKIAVQTKLPQVAYRETITKKASSSYRHKKQSGGHGQFGEVHFELSPIERGKHLSFINTIKGGAVSKGYIPGIEKGIADGMQEGVLAWYPVVDIEVNLFDGKEHDVDSSEMSFRLASKGCLKACLEKASPTLLEPIMKLTVYSDDQYIGDILSDLSSRRGKVLGQDSIAAGIQEIKAEVPEAELLKYAIDLKSITSGTGSFEVEFSHYFPISGKIAETVINEAKARRSTTAAAAE